MCAQYLSVEQLRQMQEHFDKVVDGDYERRMRAAEVENTSRVEFTRAFEHESHLLRNISAVTIMALEERKDLDFQMKLKEEPTDVCLSRLLMRAMYNDGGPWRVGNEVVVGSTSPVGGAHARITEINEKSVKVIDHFIFTCRFEGQT